MFTPITDEQLREACNRLGLNPLGTIDAELPDQFAPYPETWDNDTCYSFIASGEWAPAPGPLGFAVGHPSPGWLWLRGLVDHVAVALQADRFDNPIDPEVIDEFYKEQAGLRSKLLAWDEALIAVADIGVNENSVESAEYITSSMDMRNRFTEVAYDLLDYIGFMMCRELFTNTDQKGQQ